MNEKIISWDDFIAALPSFISKNKINKKWHNAVKQIKEKIIVLDDDPTGIQTVHSVPIYTFWHFSILRQIMRDKHKVVYILQIHEL